MLGRIVFVLDVDGYMVYIHVVFRQKRQRGISERGLVETERLRGRKRERLQAHE